MNKQTLTFAIVVTLAFNLNLSAQSNIIYVKNGGNGKGDSWATATNKLQDALKNAKKGTQIWVAKGAYFPTEGTDRTISFNIPDGVELYGGFDGTENNVSLRNIEQNETILSGNIGSNDNDDNSYNVVYTKNVSSNTKLNGFTIEGGNANKNETPSARERSGGAWFNESTAQKQSNPTIINCRFADNFARDGGAMYNYGKNNGDASPAYTNCLFEGNTSDLDGGVIYNDGRKNGKSSPTFTGCMFKENKGNYGGAVFNYGMNGESLPSFVKCTFYSNNAYVKGGAVFHLTNTPMDNATMFVDCNFNNNSALDHDSDDIHQYLIGEAQMATK